ncbi:hypothetical protein WR25_12178 isoform B [Diploscapter pachys]|uniref:Aldehyde dehydrogenase domain-containing protein n=1 Tax=Diploscapter pachys TaxID=2018661 RepID=A0A2A2LH51_9BILA|nr:hypothetical protein WR25_12178 isoform B [Diploscapter pachys]
MSFAEKARHLVEFPNGEHEALTNFINNEFVPANSKREMDSVNPATGKSWIKIPDSDREDVDRAVKAAQNAFKSWSTTSVQIRSKLLMKLANLLEENLDGLAEIESRDQGKPVWLAKAIDIPRCIHNFRFFASAILHHTAPSTLIEEPVKALNYVKHDPIGVAALISPWNLPLYLLSFKIAPAIASGNTVVCKPSELTSVSAWLLMHAIREVGFPEGVVNMVIGTGQAVGEPLVTHPNVPLVSFTGSTVIGKRIAEIAAKWNKKVSLEMGGKNACIVYPSANLQRDLPIIARSCFINQGEICLCSSRLFVHESIFDEFLKGLISEAEKLKVGDPTSAESKLGAMNSEVHFNKVKSYIELAQKEEKVHCGGVVKMDGKCENGYFIAPTIVTDISDESRCMKEEIFGPVVCLSKFKTQEV